VVEPGDHGIGGIGHFDSLYARFVKNFHDRYGIYAVRGPGIRAGNAEDRHIMDIAPTVLHLLNLEIPSWMDGKAMAGLFLPGAIGDARVSKPGRAEARAAVAKLLEAGRLPRLAPRKGG